MSQVHTGTSKQQYSQHYTGHTQDLITMFKDRQPPVGLMGLVLAPSATLVIGSVYAPNTICIALANLLYMPLRPTTIPLPCQWWAMARRATTIDLQKSNSDVWTCPFIWHLAPALHLCRSPSLNGGAGSGTACQKCACSSKQSTASSLLCLPGCTFTTRTLTSHRWLCVNVHACVCMCVCV